MSVQCSSGSDEPAGRLRFTTNVVLPGLWLRCCHFKNHVVFKVHVELVHASASPQNGDHSCARHMKYCMYFGGTTSRVHSCMLDIRYGLDMSAQRNLASDGTHLAHYSTVLLPPINRQQYYHHGDGSWLRLHVEFTYDCTRNLLFVVEYVQSSYNRDIP